MKMYKMIFMTLVAAGFLVSSDMRSQDCTNGTCPYVAVQRMWHSSTTAALNASGIFLVQKSEGGAYLVDSTGMPITNMNLACPNCKQLLSDHFCTRAGGVGIPCQPTDTIVAASITDCLSKTIVKSPVQGTFNSGC
ncbi:MAG: hypothetical protein P4L31_07880 [Candidatus Babeliales bacterium]|nr:hypothetical protein [Candidatus Babeliales bacterium]